MGRCYSDGGFFCECITSLLVSTSVLTWTINIMIIIINLSIPPQLYRDRQLNYHWHHGHVWTLNRLFNPLQSVTCKTILHSILTILRKSYTLCFNAYRLFVFASMRSRFHIFWVCSFPLSTQQTQFLIDKQT